RVATRDWRARIHGSTPPLTVRTRMATSKSSVSRASNPMTATRPARATPWIARSPMEASSECRHTIRVDVNRRAPAKRPIDWGKLLTNMGLLLGDQVGGGDGEQRKGEGSGEKLRHPEQPN